MLINPNVSDDDIYYVSDNDMRAKSHLEGFSDFYKYGPNDKIWFIDPVPREIGPLYFSFDRKTIYNFWPDYDKLTEEQKAIFRKWNPLMISVEDNDESESD